MEVFWVCIGYNLFKILVKLRLLKILFVEWKEEKRGKDRFILVRIRFWKDKLIGKGKGGKSL